MKTAILQVADTGPLESLVVMLRAAGYDCYIPSGRLKGDLRSLGCDTVLDIQGLVDGMGYERPMALPEAPVAMMETCDLYVDIKAHRNGPRVWRRWERLKTRTLWYRINGGQPEHVIKPSGEDCGDERNSPCPILTPNLWYREPGPWAGRAYSCWPPFHRAHEYLAARNPVDPPICLIHNVYGWGYGKLIDEVRKLGVKVYGAGSPDGLINHEDIPRMLSRAKCMIHLKSSDAPGYSLYESLSAACPVVVSRRLIWRNLMDDLFGGYRFIFDKPTHDALTDDDVAECTREIKKHLDELDDPVINAAAGASCRIRLNDVIWKPEKDTESLRRFFQTNFPEH